MYSVEVLKLVITGSIFSLCSRFSSFNFLFFSISLFPFDFFWRQPILCGWSYVFYRQILAGCISASLGAVALKPLSLHFYISSRLLSSIHQSTVVLFWGWSSLPFYSLSIPQTTEQPCFYVSILTFPSLSLLVSSLHFTSFATQTNNISPSSIIDSLREPKLLVRLPNINNAPSWCQSKTGAYGPN